MKDVIIFVIIYIFIFLIINQIFEFYERSKIKEGMELIWENSGKIKSMKNILNEGKKKLKSVMFNGVLTNNILEQNNKKIKKNKGNQKQKVNDQENKMKSIKV